jgi:outer membrane protein assembly factor BamB
MSDVISQTNSGPWMLPAAARPRLWPGVLIVALTWAIIILPGRLLEGTMASFMIPFMGSMIMPVVFAIWWLFASRVRWADRFIVLFACAAVGGATFAAMHPTVRSLGLMAATFYILPVVTTAWVAWLLIARWLSRPVQLVGLVVVFVLAWGYFAAVRFEGTDGSFVAAMPYRWNPSAEDQFLAERAAVKSKGGDSPTAAKPVELTAGDWPAFRGADRDGKRTGVRIATDWNAHPPRQVWRHRVGPGWSSFAVAGGRLYTQEQRGEVEAIVCYDADTGVEVWAHTDEARFDEPIGGPGPRATPTVHDGKVYAQGARGRLNCLDAATGSVAWSKDILADTSAKLPQWGFSASPLVMQGVVAVFAGGPDGKSVIAYDAATGKQTWAAGDGTLSYCSPHPARIDGVEQMLIATDRGLTAFDPPTGKVLWTYDWPLDGQMARVVQPTLLGDGDLLLGTGFGYGTRRVHVGRTNAGWTTDEKWTSLAIKPYYNDLVVHDGNLYGFDGVFLTCVSLTDGRGKWKARGYGNGQMLLLADQGLLLVLSEKGEAALVEANAERHVERAKFQAISGKTWNHPVVAHGKLFVRNGEEMACYELAPDSAAVAGK